MKGERKGDTAMQIGLNKEIIRYDTKSVDKEFGCLIPIYRKLVKAHKQGAPLLVYPKGQGPLYRGLENLTL
jgi:hypothetical protein